MQKTGQKLQNKSQLYSEDFAAFKRDSNTRGELLHLAVVDSHQSNTAARSYFNNSEPTHACLLTVSSALVRFAGMPESEWNEKQNFGNRCIIFMGFSINIQNKKTMWDGYKNSVKCASTFDFNDAVEHVGELKLNSSSSSNEALKFFKLSLDFIIFLWTLLVTPTAVTVEINSKLFKLLALLSLYDRIQFPISIVVKYNLMLSINFSQKHKFNTCSWSNFNLEAFCKNPDWNFKTKCLKSNPKFRNIVHTRSTFPFPIPNPAPYINLIHGNKQENLLGIFNYFFRTSPETFGCLGCDFTTANFFELTSHLEFTDKIKFVELF